MRFLRTYRLSGQVHDMKTGMEARQGIPPLTTCELFFFKYIFINFNSLNIFAQMYVKCMKIMSHLEVYIY